MGCAVSINNAQTGAQENVTSTIDPYWIDREENMVTVHSESSSMATDFDSLAEDLDDSDSIEERLRVFPVKWKGKQATEMRKKYRQTRSDSGEVMSKKAAKVLLTSEERRDSGINLDYDSIEDRRNGKNTIISHY